LKGEFKASSGWLTRFKEEHDIWKTVIQGKSYVVIKRLAMNLIVIFRSSM
jgi:hypothetical protein